MQIGDAPLARQVWISFEVFLDLPSLHAETVPLPGRLGAQSATFITATEQLTRCRSVTTVHRHRLNRT